MAEWAFIAMGSNLGDRDKHLAHGRARLASLPRTMLRAESMVEETDPIGPGLQGRYLNQMVLLHTELSPMELLSYCHAIERETGRVRTTRWGARTLDLDIVRYGDLVVERDDLAIPHPELANRAFWQREVAELEPHVG